MTFVPDKSGKVTQVFSGAQWYASAAYNGPRTFAHQAAWDALTGRYEAAEEWGFAPSSRVFAVKGQLTLDGSPLARNRDGSYKIGSSTVRFDTLAGGKMQRMWLDGIPMYRIDLP